MALGAIGGGPIHILGAGSDSMQGDMAFADVVQEMGATVVRHADSIEVSGPRVAQGETLRAFDRDFNLIPDRSEEHTSELQSLMRISYAVFCLTKKKKYRTLYLHSL